MTTRTLFNKVFTQAENDVRAKLYQEQNRKMQTTNAVHSMLRDGYLNAQLPSDHCPDALQVSKCLFEHTGRKLTNAQNPYLSDQDRYAPLYDHYFPATNYIRTMDELDFTPLPDMAHDYFGHMPWMFHPQLAQLQRKFADMYHRTTDTQKQDIYNLGRYVIEYSIVMEHNKANIFGAGLLSSPGDFQRFVDDQFKLIDASLTTIISTPRSPDKPHTALFVFESFEAMKEIVDLYDKTMTWVRDEHYLSKIFQFQDFASAIAWMQSCSKDIDQIDHHPERRNIYNRVEVRLTTHDLGNTLSDKDYTLASILDRHYEAYRSPDQDLP